MKSMLLRGSHGEKIYFDINGDIRKNSNWLKVTINAQLKDMVWKSSDRVLQVQELRKLLDWFKKMILGNPDFIREIDFIEPELSFELVSDNMQFPKKIKLYLQHNLLPQSMDDTIKSFEFDVSKKELLKIINSLEPILTKN